MPLLSLRRASPSAVAVRLVKLILLLGFCFAVSTITSYIASILDEANTDPTIKFSMADMHTPSVFKGFSTKDPAQLLASLGFSTDEDFKQEEVAVLTLTYPGGGAEVLEKSLGVLTGVFHLDEPHVNLLYPAMYGVSRDGAIPFNILMDHRGDIRRFPRAEAYESLKLYRNLLECKFSTLPVHMLLSPYWASQKQKTFSRYVQCARGSDVHLSPPHDSLSTCQRAITGICPAIFTLNPNMGNLRIQNCSAIFYANGSFTDEDHPGLWAQFSADATIQRSRKKFNTYFVCVKSHEEKLRRCAETHLDQVCLQSPVKLITASTMTMYIAQQLLKLYPSMHFVHLLRDPRGVAFRRAKLGPVDGQYATYEKSDPLSLASSYCRLATDHVMSGIRVKMESKHRIIGLSYDKVMYNLTNNLFNLMKHMKINPTIEGAGKVLDFISLEGHDMVRENFRWPISLSADVVSDINDECTTLLDEMAQNTKSLSTIKHKYVL